MATGSQWLLLTWLGLSAAWMDERPVLESRDGSLFISAAKDKNITLKVHGSGFLNVNDYNLLKVTQAAVLATRRIERWRTGYMTEVESNLQRLSQIVEGPDGLERKIAMMRFIEGNSTLQPLYKNETAKGINVKIRLILQRLRKVEDKVKSIETKLKVNECTSNPCLNGGACQDLYDGYQCNCPSNWEGPNCMVDVNECVRLLGTDLGCQNGATCHNLPGSYRCDCAPGWFGLHCTKKDSICNTQNSIELCGHGVCVAKPGSPLGYICICDQGWQSEGTNPACIKDVNECTGNHRPCSVNPWVECRNAPGTFFCDSCPQGYTGNGYYCTDIDECLQDNGGCSTTPRVQCINTMGSRMCGPCPTGYQGNGVTCTYVGGCAINNGGCHPLARCIDSAALTSAYVICRCPDGMIGDGMGPNGCQASPTNLACASNPCVYGRCVGLGLHSYNCVCNPGYTGATCNASIDMCSPNPCKNNGVCVISNGAIACDCPSTYTGARCEKPRQTCGGVSRNPVGHLEFPIGGNVYQHGLSCAWVLVTNSSLVLNVTFTRFNLELSPDCKYDFLQIHDGRNAGSQMIGRFCGDKVLHGNGTIVSSHNSLYFWFHSDSSISHDGFAFHWNSIEPVCGGRLTNDYGTISSPGSPGRYPPNRDCYWTITVKPSKRIQIHFGQLMLEEHPTCNADYLAISTIHGENLGRYCNHTHPPPLVVPSSKAVIYFHSDNAGQDAGFQIHYSAIEGLPGCNDVYTLPSGVINNPSNMNSVEELECEWKIQMSVGERVEISWTQFDLAETDCSHEYVEVYDGESIESPLIGRYCGKMIPLTVRTNSNVVLVLFKSTLLGMKGTFALSYNVICGGTFTQESGIIQSPTNPPSDRMLRCIYDITQPSDRRIVLNILSLDIRRHPLKSDCDINYFRVYDGLTENNTRLANLCGTDAVTSKDDVTFYSTHNSMMLKYVNMASPQDRGFIANYTTFKNRCGGLYTESNGMIQSPSKDGVYTNDEECIWTIVAPPGNVVQLTWLNFDLEHNIRCRFDYVSAYENYLSSGKELLGTFCGSTKPPVLITEGNTLTIVFHSDSSINRNGFVATYIFIDARKVCGGHFLKSVGVIRSPEYPRAYPNRKECTWIIEAPNRQRIILNITHFELEGQTNCLFDYLEIRNGGYDNSPLIGKYCGTNIPTEIISQTNKLYLKFVSDQSRSFPGFYIEWDSTTIGCGGDLHAANGDIISPNYPKEYSQLAECQWRIMVAEGSWLRLTIVDLQLEEHVRCRADYIEISEGFNRRNSQRYCGNPYPNIIETTSNIMNIRFRSDYTSSGRGFHLKYETVCRNTVQGFHGVIESPNFPEKYDHNLNCSWKIVAPIGNKINLTFSHFELEGFDWETGCNYDYVDIGEGENDEMTNHLVRLCGSETLPEKIHSSMHEVFVNLVTDSMIAYGGFRLEWVVDGCGGHLTRPFGEFTSPGYPSSYPYNVNCEWLIEVDHTHSIELTIHDINTEKQASCYFDKLQIYSGENDNAPLLVEICYSKKPVIYTSFGNKMFLRFHSDISYASRGFNVSYKTVPIKCGGLYTADTGIIFSTNYPQNYPKKENCEWLLQVDRHHVVNFTFLDFDLEETINCTDDYVEVYDGPTKNSPLMGRHCRTAIPPPYLSTANEMLIVMRTDGILSAKGFKAKYAKACGARITIKDDEPGYLTPSMSYTLSEPFESNELNCTWILVAENPADHVTVTFSHIDINVDGFYYDDHCSWNHVEVFEGEGLDGPSHGKWCDNVVPLPVTSSGNALTVNLHSSYDFVGHFALTYTTLNSACGGNYTSYKGRIASPNYPNSYPLDAECIWILHTSPGSRLSLTFNEFDLQQSENCELDYLEIREESGIGKLISTSCGKLIAPVLTFKNLWIKFKSEGDDVGKGFVAEFTMSSSNELSGPVGRITSPLYPIPYLRSEPLDWRITVEFGSVIRIDVTDLFIESPEFYCHSQLEIFDGYNTEAPSLLATCGLDRPKPVTTSSNVAFIKLTMYLVRQGSVFDLNWIQIPRDFDPTNPDKETKLGNCSEEITLTYPYANSHIITSPGWPNGYDVNLQCSWLFTSPVGTHLLFKAEVMDLEESFGCLADYVSVYSGNALMDTDDTELLGKLCLANSTSLWLENDNNVMTVKFQSDSYLNKTGFRAHVFVGCGGKMEGPNGVIEIGNSTTMRGNGRGMQDLCKWTVEVRSGRMIEVKIKEMSIKQGPSFTCTDNYLMLKNGGEETSPLLGAGMYCGDVTPTTLQTTGNRLFVKAHGLQGNIRFMLTYREVGIDCGGQYILSNKQKKWEISTPNYPNIPHPFSECTWTVMASNKDRITLNFIERFDLSNTLNCEDEYVEVRDGGTDSSKLLGRYCKDVAPSTMISTGNVMYVHFYTNVPEPRNGFKAVFSIGENCGGIIREDKGIISSPNYPLFYPKNETCLWIVVGPTDHTLKFNFLDIHLPGFRVCKNSDYVQIFDKMPMNDTSVFYNDFSSVFELGTYCTQTIPEPIETASNEAVVKFTSDNFEYIPYRGFSMNFSSSREVCGGEYTAMEATLKSSGYPNVATRPRYCDWRIKVPRGFHVVIEILDMDITTQVLVRYRDSRVGLYPSFYNDFRYKSRIKLNPDNSTVGLIRSSSNMMMVGFYLTSGHRGLKFRYHAEAPAPCGGVISYVRGNLTGPRYRPFNESSYYCQWEMQAPENMIDDNNNNYTELTFTVKVMGVVNGLPHLSRNRICYNNQYISVTGKIINNPQGKSSSPVASKLCGRMEDHNITSTSNELWIEYMGTDETNDFEFFLEPANNGCGGVLRANSREIASPKFPARYPNNAECTWEINADSGYHISLRFVDRFNLETSANCEKDYIQIFDWTTLSNDSLVEGWKELGKVCGRDTPPAFNSSGSSMKVVFHSNEAIQGDGFRAVWTEACGGIYEVTSKHRKTIVSPRYPKYYPKNIFCNYTLLAPEKSMIIKFIDFQLETSIEGLQKACRYDNLTMKYIIRYGEDEQTWCGTDKPPIIKSKDRTEIIFRTDNFLQRAGFAFEYFLNDCGGTITAPTDISSLSNGQKYVNGLHCNWEIKAPADKSIVLRFELFEMEYTHQCYFDKVLVYEGLVAEDSKKLATLCGNLTRNLPIIKSRSNSMLVRFEADEYGEYRGIAAKVMFTKSEEAGCGGSINLTATQNQSFKTQMGTTYDSLEDCHWTVITSPGKNIKFTINKMDIRYFIYSNSTDKCTGDFIELRDGAGPHAELIGRYCGNQPPIPIFSSTSALWIRFFSDGTEEGTGVTGTLEAVDGMCGFAPAVINNTKQVLTSPNYPNNYEVGSRCRWLLRAEGLYVDRLHIRFLDFDLTNSKLCEDDYVQIRDTSNRQIIEEGFGENFIWSEDDNRQINDFQPMATYKYCGDKLPHDYYSYSTEIEVMFKSDIGRHKGFKLEYGTSTCDRNFTAETGRIIHDSIEDCWITITAPPNHTISLYFNQIIIYDADECTSSALQVFDGDFNGKLMASLCNVGVPSPLFSTGNKVSLHSWTQWHNTYEYYDITYTTTDQGRGCGGRIFNYGGSFSSPMYPNEYRNDTNCIWEISVPVGLKVTLTFTVFDIGTKSTCNYSYNLVGIYNYDSNGELQLAHLYCGGDEPAPFEATGNRIRVTYASSVNNVGTGWTAIFNSKSD
ncbi:cubilin [Ceratina calcarata]|uniref:Cubilin n=1 Tax=Ceratina calcarata TaxID=156304 RepID=A0AAJ7J0C3_9HYME|nr:cubilin [Ceratina calcarata]